MNTQVLEFGLGTEQYCIEISHIAEIVDREELTSVPNSARHVEGVMDLRGKTTTIIDPKKTLGIGTDGEGKRIIVFESEHARTGNDTDEAGTADRDQNPIGWLTDEVYRVSQLSEEDVDRSIGNDSVKGMVKREQDERNFVTWIDPAAVNN